MDYAKLKSAFDEPSRLFDNTNNRLRLGMGLWVLKNVILKMGGRIKVYSKEGFGTTAVVLLPY